MTLFVTPLPAPDLPSCWRIVVFLSEIVFTPVCGRIGAIIQAINSTPNSISRYGALFTVSKNVTYFDVSALQFHLFEV